MVAPGLNALSDAAAKNLIEYVHQGGHLVLGQRSVMKDEDNGLQPQRQPGPLAPSWVGELSSSTRSIRVAVSKESPARQSKLWAEC